MTRNNVPIAEYPLSGGLNVGIGYSVSFEVFDSAIAAGANIEDLWKIDNGEYPPAFIAKLIAWNRGRKLIDNNVEDASIQQSKSKR